MTYSQKLRDPRWQKKRLSIFERDGFTCKYCSDSKSELQVHHLKYSGEPWEANNSDLVTCCKHCHNVIEHTKLIDGNCLFVKSYKNKESGVILIMYKQLSEKEYVLGIYDYNFSNDSFTCRIRIWEQPFEVIKSFFSYPKKTTDGEKKVDGC